MKKIKDYIIVLTFCFVALMPQNSAAHIFETRAKVDTLTWSERLSLHTNAVDWTLLVPNIGIEYDLRSTNWNRWAVGLTLRNRWKTSATFKPDKFYNLTEARVYVRNYWRTRQIDNRSIFAHTSILDRLFSCRRRRVKHPETTYYRGLYASYSDFSFKFGHEGNQGKAYSVGFTYGCVYPLYTFSSGNTLDLDLGVDVGIVYTQAEKFVLAEDDNCYVRTSESKGKIVPFPLPTEARVGLVYRFGKYPITKKYRWRYDVDIAYQERIDDIRRQRDSIRTADHYNDSIRNVLYHEFWTEYDSVARVNSKNAQQVKLETAKQNHLKQAEAKAEKQNLKKAEKDSKKKKNEQTPVDTTKVGQVPSDTIKVEQTVSDTAKVEQLPADTAKVDPKEEQIPATSETEKSEEQKPAEAEPQTEEQKPAEADPQTEEQKPAEAEPQAEEQKSEEVEENKEPESQPQTTPDNEKTEKEPEAQPAEEGKEGNNE